MARFLYLIGIFAIRSNANPIPLDKYKDDPLKVSEALHVIQSIGVDLSTICHETSNSHRFLKKACGDLETSVSPSHHNIIRLTQEEDESQHAEFENENENKNLYEILFNLLMAALCVVLAALAAGLTMGLLSLDSLELHIKQRASNDVEERAQCATLLPVLKNHHRLLVTLLLLNSIANEALPLFLDELVPGYVAVIISVTLVLFFGEIIPSAVFTGPQKLAIAAKMVPLVQICLWLLSPLAIPIAKMLDKFLGEHSEEDEKYDRKELAELVKVMYEEQKRKRNQKKLAMKPKDERLRESKRQILRGVSDTSENSGRHSSRNVTSSYASTIRRSRLTLDEVNIVEGVLQMREETVKNILTTWNEVYCLKKSDGLDEDTIQRVYEEGHSRVPVYDDKSRAHNQTNITKAVCGICMSRDLMVVHPNEHSTTSLSDMSLHRPRCISPTTNLVDALNILQSGGHLAIVCHDPEKATHALELGEPIPPDANVIGIVSLEDIIESIIQEEIYDEADNENSENAKLLSQDEDKHGFYDAMEEIV